MYGVLPCQSIREFKMDKKQFSSSSDLKVHDWNSQSNECIMMEYVAK